MKTTWDPEMSMLSARGQYFEANGFGPTGGYDDGWVDFKLGPLPFPFPNTPARLRAVRYHDLHHVLTGYPTDIRGEFEISAWEIGAGCKDFIAAWQLNLGGMAGGLLIAPRRTFRAFVRGRRSSTLYGADYQKLLEMRVGDARAAHVADDVTHDASAADVALFALATAVGIALGLAMFVAFLPLVPIGLAVGAWRTSKRRDGAPA